MVLSNPNDPFSAVEQEAPPPNPDGTYSIHRILPARKRDDGQWVVLIKWEGWEQPTEETRADMYRNCGDRDILKEMESCIDRARRHDRGPT